MSRKPQLPVPAIPQGTYLSGPSQEQEEAILKRLDEKYERRLRREGHFAFGLDATGSMSGVISSARHSIEAIVTRARERANASIHIRLYAFRDYDDPRTLLEKSSLTQDAAALRNWLAGIVAQGGGDHEEAMEAALREMHADFKYNAVFILGDARPRTTRELSSVRPQERCAEEWAHTLSAKGTKVHALWVKSEGASSADFAAYQRVAQQGGGVCGQLDRSDIVDIAVMAILESLQGAGAVEAYAKDYHLSSGADRFKALLLGYNKS